MSHLMVHHKRLCLPSLRPGKLSTGVSPYQRMVALPRLSAGCCFTLKTATVLTGVWNLALTLSVFIFGIVLTANPTQSSEETINGELDWLIHVSPVVVAQGSYLTLGGLTLMAISLCLIQGARTVGRWLRLISQEHTGLMTPWLILTAISLVLMPIIMLGAILKGNIGGIFGSLISWIHNIYLYLVVHSYKEELEEARGGREAQPKGYVSQG